MSHIQNFTREASRLILASLLLSLSVSLSSDFSAPVTVTNRTPLYLHLSINDNTFTYISPHTSIRTEVQTASVIIEAIYSPGQNASGAFSRSYPTSVTTTVENGGTTCNDNRNYCTSTMESTSTTTPLPVLVEIFADSLR